MLVIATTQHTNAFGVILYHYAAAESGLKICLAGMAEMDLRIMLILTEPYSAVNLRNVCKSMAKCKYTSDDPLRDRFCHLAGELGSFGPLRNHIAHSRWTNGQRLGSIKPIGVDIRSGSPKFLGREPGERDWTAKELAQEAELLRALNANIVQFMDDSGISAAMDLKDDNSNNATDS